MRRVEPRWQYAHGSRVRLAQRTLAALARGAVYCDADIEPAHASAEASVRRRSQFCAASQWIGALYETLELVEV